MTPQRRLGTSVAACLAGSALAIYGATRVWSILVTERPGLTDLRATSTGAARAPWLIGLALVTLAGTGALLATRGTARRVLGGLLTLAGLGIIAAAITARLGVDPGAAGAGATVWPIACVIGGALIIWSGYTAARHGQSMPAMSSRYERSTVPPEQPGVAATPAPTAAAGLSRKQDRTQDRNQVHTPDTERATAAAENRAAWDALDRGDDPTT